MFTAGLLFATLFVFAPTRAMARPMPYAHEVDNRAFSGPQGPPCTNPTQCYKYTRCFGEGCGPRRWRRALNNTSDTIPGSTVLHAVPDGVSVQGGDGGLAGSGGDGGNGGDANGGDANGGDAATLGLPGHCASGTVSVGGHTVVVENGQIVSVDGVANDGSAEASGDVSVTQYL